MSEDASQNSYLILKDLVSLTRRSLTIVMFYLSVLVAALVAWYATRVSHRQADLFINGVKSNDESVQPGSGQFFDEIAPTYDMLNNIISLGYHSRWRKTAISKISSATSLLDVSTGTADMAIAVATNRSIRVVGLDPSPNMLAIAKKKHLAAGNLVGPVEFVEGSVENLPFKDGTFDAVTVAFGVRNFADRSRGLSEIARVLASNGILVVLEASMPSQTGTWAFLTRTFVRNVVPIAGALVSGNPRAYRYLGKSMHEFPNKTEFSNMLVQAGLHVISYDRLPPLKSGPDLYVAAKLDEDL